MEINNLENIKVYITIGTAIISFATLLVSLKINKRSILNNSVTKERIESLTSLKNNLAEFNSLIYTYIVSEKTIDINRVYFYKNLIEYQFNNTKDIEKDIVIKLEKIVFLTCELVYTQNESKEEFLKKFEAIDFKNGDSLIYINNKQFVKSILKIEFDLFEYLTKNHLKSEWEKVKDESNLKLFY